MREYISQEDWDDWKSMEVTKKFFSFLKDEAAVRRELAGSGVCIVSDDFAAIGAAYIKLINNAECYEAVTNIEREDILTGEDTVYEDTSSRT